MGMSRNATYALLIIVASAASDAVCPEGGCSASKDGADGKTVCNPNQTMDCAVQKAKTDQRNQMIVQAVFGVIFYFLVASKYEAVKGENAKSTAIMAEGTCCRIQPGVPCMLAWCCPAATLAHNLNATGSLNYWVALIGALLCPCCTVWYGASFSEHNEKLGGKKECCNGCMLAFCCNCCLQTQWLQAADAATGQTTGFFAVTPTVNAREPLLEVAPGQNTV